MLRTPLYNAHITANAKMVDFSGWSMPINYGSQIQEHNNVRENCGIFDVSHMLAVDIKGKDAENFLRYILANDIAMNAAKNSGKTVAIFNLEMTKEELCFRMMASASRVDNNKIKIEQPSARALSHAWTFSLPAARP